MATVKVCKAVHITSGDIGNSFAQSIVGTAGSAGIPSGYYGVDMYLWVCIMSDQSVHIAFDGGWVRANSKTGTPSSRWLWKLWFAVNDSSFSIYDGPSGLSTPGHWIYNDGGILPSSVGDSNPGHQYYDIPTRAQAQVGATSLPTGYTAITPWVSQAEGRIGFYISGLVEYANAPDDDVSMPSQFIEITDTDIINEYFDYYPWERRISDTWYSLNREGGKSTTAGLFRRINDAWSPCTNRQGSSTADDHGFRYNNGWQKSPKSGQGA